MTKKYVRTGSRNSTKTVYHIDADCVQLKGDKRIVAESEIEYHSLTLCQWCDPDANDPNAQYDQDHSYQQALKEAANDD